MTSCSNIFNDFGFSCSQVRLPRGDDATYISTPFTLAHGKPLDLFLVESGDSICITDDGFSMAEMIASGINLSDRRTWRGLADLAESFGFELDDNGALTSHATHETLSIKLQSILSVFAGVCSWEKERLESRDADLSFYLAVEKKLRAIDDNRKLIPNATKVFGGQSYDFDFQWGDTLVDTVRPHHNAVNAKLRKVTEISLACEEAPDVLFIVDDSGDTNRASKECKVLGVHSRAVLFHQLQAA